MLMISINGERYFIGHAICAAASRMCMHIKHPALQLQPILDFLNSMDYMTANSKWVLMV